MNDGLWLRPAAAAALDESVNRRIQSLAAWLGSNRPAGVIDVIPGYGSLYVRFDRGRLSGAALRQLLEQADAEPVTGRDVTIPVRYGGGDLQRLSQESGLTAEQLITIHTAGPYHVYSTSFSPGMPLAGSLDAALHFPRLGSPRRSVPAGSVAVAGAQTGVYTVPTPGGWNLLGRALINLYDPQRPEPFLVRPLDRISFTAAAGEPPELPGHLELLPAVPSRPRLLVREAGLLDLVVDRGRTFTAVHGLSSSGAADTRSAAIANALLGNHPDAPLLELNLRGPTLEATGTLVAALTGDALLPLVNGEPVMPWSSFVLRQGDRLGFRSSGKGARSYLAIAGGIEAASFLGSRSTDLKGRIGRPLAAGDLLGAARESSPRPGRSFRGFQAEWRPVTLTLERGPQFSPEAAEALSRQVFTVQAHDRMGVRLAGGAVPGGEVVSEPVPPGSLQVTASGEPMILLNDRGLVGGYAKPAVITPAHLPLAAQLVTGDRIRFRWAG